MKKIYSEIAINASADKVWNILTNLKDYPNWNPFIKCINGKLKKGNSLEVFISPPDAKGMKFTPIILEYVKNKELKWLGKLLINGLFDGEHEFRIEVLGPNKVKFIQTETFRGLLVPLFSSVLIKTKKGFQLMNMKLKEKAEK